jgi:hypothetical protein
MSGYTEPKQEQNSGHGGVVTWCWSSYQQGRYISLFIKVQLVRHNNKDGVDMDGW